MPNGKTEKTIGVLGKEVVETLANTATDDNLKLLNAFSITGLDYKGQLTSGFGDRGFGFSFGVSFNFGDLILPGLVDAIVGANLSGKSTHYSMVLLQRFPKCYFDLPSAAQSQPSIPPTTWSDLTGEESVNPVWQGNLTGEQGDPTDEKDNLTDEVEAGKAQSQSPKADWQTSTPVGLLILDGTAKTMEARVNAKIGVGVDASAGELGLKLKAEAEAEASVQGRLLRLTCRQPEYYAEASDDKLYDRVFGFFAASLPGAVKDWLTTVLVSEKESEDEMRKELTNLFEGNAKALLSEWAGGLPKLPDGIKIEGLKNAVAAQKKEPTSKDLLDALEALDKLLEAKIAILETTVPGTEGTEPDKALDQAKTQRMQASLFKKQLEYLITPSVVKEWLAEAWVEIKGESKTDPPDKLKSVLKKDKPKVQEVWDAVTAVVSVSNQRLAVLAGQKPKTPEEQARYNRLLRIDAQLSRFRKTLKEMRDVSKADQSRIALKSSTPRPHLHLAVVTGQAGAGAKASLSLQVAGVGAEAGASASVKGSANLVSYRFQSRGAGNNGDLVMTQDTIITYREVDVAAALDAKLGLEIPDSDDHPHKKELEKKGEWHYRTMTYRSAVAYWMVPTVPRGEKTSTTISIGEGSGLVLGCSVQLQRLIKLITEFDKKKGIEVKDTELNTLVGRLSNSLHVPQKTLKDFLWQDAGALADAKPAQFKTDSLLLEAGFAFPRETRTLEAKYNDKTGWELGKLLEHAKVKTFLDSEPSKLPLQVIRLRYRLSDRWNEEETIFKLGFSRLLGLQFQVDRVRGAGHEGVIDLATCFYDPEPIEWNENPTEGYERSIPPVALLHN